MWCDLYSNQQNLCFATNQILLFVHVLQIWKVVVGIIKIGIMPKR